MATLNLRGLPKELVARVKAQAALDGETILQWVRRVLEAQFGAEASVSVKAPATEVKASMPAPREADEGRVHEHGGGINERRHFPEGSAAAGVHEGRHSVDGSLHESVRADRVLQDTRDKPRGIGKAVSKQMSADEFMNLPVSEQLRARREGKF